MPVPAHSAAFDPAGRRAVTARTLAVRARVEGRPEAPYDRIHDALTHDLLTEGPVARERFPGRWNDAAALRALVETKRRPLPVALAAELSEYHRRLGASPASLANVDRLARGEAVAAVAGQQPAPLVGPLYALHKVASTAGIAAAVTARTGAACVPLFWMHGEDSDFSEIRHATLSDASGVVHDLALPDEAHREGGLVGAVARAPLATLTAEALALWQGLPAHGETTALLQRALAAGRDLGEATNALLLALFAEPGLVVVDPRLPSIRAAAREILERYLANSDALERAAKAAGARLATLAGRQPLSDASLESFVFRIEDGRRQKLTAAEARAHGTLVTLSPSVALRPAVQDGVFPTVAMAVGPGEIAYLAQLKEVFEGVSVQPALLVPRFGATWLPAEALALIDACDAEPWSVVANADAALARLAERNVPHDLAKLLADARDSALGGLARFAEASRSLDGSLPQMVESARGKVDYQFARLHEGLSGKARARLDRDHPAWRRLRYVLMPGDRLQERRLASLEPVVRRGASVIADVVELAAEHAGRAASGVHEHYLLELGA